MCGADSSKLRIGGQEGAAAAAVSCENILCTTWLVWRLEQSSVVDGSLLSRKDKAKNYGSPQGEILGVLDSALGYVLANQGLPSH